MGLIAQITITKYGSRDSETILIKRREATNNLEWKDELNLQQDRRDTEGSSQSSTKYLGKKQCHSRNDDFVCSPEFH